jgi:hypothetical protein
MELLNFAKLSLAKIIFNLMTNMAKLGYNIMKGTEYFVPLQTSVVGTE